MTVDAADKDTPIIRLTRLLAANMFERSKQASVRCVDYIQCTAGCGIKHNLITELIVMFILETDVDEIVISSLVYYRSAHVYLSVNTDQTPIHIGLVAQIKTEAWTIFACVMGLPFMGELDIFGHCSC